MAVEKEMMDRAQMRQGAMAPQQGPAPQSTVADEIAAGLAAADIPDNMFADGGIVSFQSGGGMYQQAYEQGERKGSIYDKYYGLPPEQRAQLKAAAEQQAGRPLDERAAADRQFLGELATSIGQGSQRAGAAIADIATMPVRGLAGAYDTAVVRPMRAAGINAGYLSPMLTPEGASVSSMTPFYDLYRGRDAAAAAPTDTGDETARLTQRYPAPVGIAAAPAARTVGAARPSGTPQAAGVARAAGARGPAPTGIAQAAPAAQGPMDAAGYMKQVQSLAGTDPSERAAADMDAATKMQVEALRKAEADTAAEEAKLGPVGAAREKSIAAKEERIAAGEGKNLKNTLIEAGLAVMGGQSPNALTNIAAGAAAGLKGYQTRLDKFEAARERVDEDRVKLEELRREAATATGTRKRQVDKEIATIEADRLRAGAAAATALYGRKVDQAKLALDMEREDTKLAQEAVLKREQMRSTENVANIYSARSGAGGNGGVAATRENRMNLTARLTSAQRDLGQYKNAFRPEAKARKAELEQEVAGLRAALAAIGPDAGSPVQSPAAPATRMRFDAQGNLIP
jgi:hypothetical protein